MPNKKICSPKTDYETNNHLRCLTKNYAVPTATVPTVPVPTAPVPTAPVPTAPVPTASVPTALVPTALVHMLPLTCYYPHAPVPHVPFPHAPVPHSPVPMLPSVKINCFNHTKTNHFNHTLKKFTPVLILRSTFSGISRTFTIFMLEAMWCEGSNPHGVEAL